MPNALPGPIGLVQVGDLDRGILEFLAGAIGRSLGASCRIGKTIIDAAGTHDPARGQHLASGVLSLALDAAEPGDGKVLAVTAHDLFVPVLTFVFGQAQLGGRGAAMSVRRLRQEFYGLPPDRDLLLLRCEKEALHELGHTFGLIHCPAPGCAMGFSNSIEEVDLKSNRFCPDCAATYVRRRAGIP
jgi:archaemetzincin